MESIMNTVLTDMAGAYIEHSVVITNFVAAVHNQLKNSVCKVFPDNVQYKWSVDGEIKTVIPDVTINCRVHARKGNSFLDIPRFIMEVVSPSTEKYDRGEKMDIYRLQEVDEYWIVDWQKKKVEIYTLDYDEKEEAKYYLWNVVTEENKNELRIVHFPNLQITFEELFAEVGV